MQPKCILLDIEGTTSSISFVHDVMFPYVRQHLKSFLSANWGSDVVSDCLPLLADDLGHDDVDGWLVSDPVVAQERVVAGVVGLMDDDVKATGLKKLQGQIWKSGFESGQMTSHVYDDVPAAIDKWLADGSQIRIYSSGSVQAQLLFFGHTVFGDLLPKFSGHYDTTIGSKKEAASYTAIAADVGLEPEEIVFVSDVVEELRAASDAGMKVILSVRPGNAVVEDESEFVTVRSFSEIKFSKVCAR